MSENIEEPIASSPEVMQCTKCKKALKVIEIKVDSDGVVRYVLERCTCGIDDVRMDMRRG